MDAALMRFVHVRPLESWLILMAGWLTIAYFVLRPFTLKQFNDRGPFILCVLNFLLTIACIILPKAFPHAFEAILGHSIYSLRFENDSRWIERWEDFFSWMYMGSLPISVVWAIVNLIRRRAWIINTLAIAFGLFYLLYTLYIGLTARFF
jgi:hypothetical protein